MPEKDLNPASGSVVNAPGDPSSVIAETVQAHMLSILGSQQQYQPTQAQVDKMLSLNEKGMDYTHKERTTFSPSQKIELFVFAIVIGVLLFVFIFCVYVVPQYAGTVLSGIVGLLAGSTGGYGYAKIKESE